MGGIRTLGSGGCFTAFAVASLCISPARSGSTSGSFLCLDGLSLNGEPTLFKTIPLSRFSGTFFAISKCLTRRALDAPAADEWLWARLAQLQGKELTRHELLMKLGSARSKLPTAWRLVEVRVRVPDQGSAFSYRLDRKKLRQVRRREGRYLLRANLSESDPVKLWHSTYNSCRSKKRSAP
jgi:hypothetical protein